MVEYHKPVLVKEVIRFLRADHALAIADATLGDGGHSQALLEAMPDRGRVLALDLDADAIARAKSRLASFSGRLTVYQGNFGRIEAILGEEWKGGLDGIIADLGVSRLQISDPAKGFMFSASGPLDMRMGADRSLSAENVVNDLSEIELGKIIKEYGEERDYKRISRAIVRKREQGRIDTTDKLAAIIRDVANPRFTIKTLARVFQAIRIFVNEEIDNLRAFLPQALRLLKPMGRLAIISYHSLEDRIVKEFMQREAFPCVCPPDLPVCVCGKKASLKIVGKLITPSEEEIADNPNARSAKLRIAEKLPPEMPLRNSGQMP